MKSGLWVGLAAVVALALAYEGVVHLLSGRDPLEAALVSFDAVTTILVLAAVLLRVVLLAFVPPTLLYLAVRAVVARFS